MDFIEVSWTALKSSMVAKGLTSRLQWLQEDDAYVMYLFDGPLRLKSAVKITKPKNAEQVDFETKFKPASNLILDPIDQDGSALSRQKVTKSGWTFQLHTIGIDTGKFAGVFNKKVNPTTMLIEELGFATIKLYKEDRTLIAAEADEGQAHYTVVDWAVNHDMEIVGGLFTQAEPPASDIRMWVYGAPGIANVPFLQGGINLKRLGRTNEVNADGKAPKFMSPTQPIPGVNKFRIILWHPTYVVHPCQMVFQLFRP